MWRACFFEGFELVLHCMSTTFNNIFVSVESCLSGFIMESDIVRFRQGDQ